MLKTAEALIEASVHAGAPPGRRRVEQLLVLPSAVIGPVDPGRTRTLQAGQLLAHVWLDRLSDLPALVAELDGTWPDGPDADLPLATRLAVDAALAEAHVMVGDPLAGLERTRHLAQSIDAATPARWQFRVWSLTAAAFALNGDWEGAERHVRRAEQTWGKGMDAGRVDYVLALAKGLLGFMRQDPEGLRDLAARLRTLVRQQPRAGPLADLAEAGALVATGDLVRATALTVRVERGPAPDGAPSLVRQFASYLRAFIILREGLPLDALAASEYEAPTGNHLLCPHAIRAVALIQLREYRRVVVETADCLAPRYRHGQLMLPLIHVCTAIAMMRLGERDLAVHLATSAVERTRAAHFNASLRILPAEDLLDLFELCDLSAPERVREAGSARVAGARGRPVGTAPFPRLSGRERVVAHAMRTEATFTQIAQDLSLSVGTVTTQASAIYRKLGVRGRDEAVDLLERSGYYDV